MNHKRNLVFMIMVFIAASMVIAIPVKAAMTVVSPVDMDGWAWQVTSSDGIGEFVVGPATPPIGVGSARLFTGTHGDEAASIRNNLYAGTKLSDLTALSYWTYVAQWNGQQAPYIILNVDNDGGGVTDDLLFFEPPYQTPASGNPSLPDQGLPVLNTWQSWDALVGGWWSLSYPGIASPGTGVQPLSVYLTNFPDAAIVNSGTLGGVRLVVGWGSLADVFDGNVDDFEIGISGGTTTYDFELAPPAPPVGGEWVPINTVQMLVELVGSILAMSAIAASFVGIKRIKRKQN